MLIAPHQNQIVNLRHLLSRETGKVGQRRVGFLQQRNQFLVARVHSSERRPVDQEQDGYPNHFFSLSTLCLISPAFFQSAATSRYFPYASRAAFPSFCRSAVSPSLSHASAFPAFHFVASLNRTAAALK